MDDLISRQAAIAHAVPLNLFGREVMMVSVSELENLPSAQPEQRWIPCGKCIHADGKHRWCKVLDRSINEDYFCYWAEPWKEGEADD